MTFSQLVTDTEQMIANTIENGGSRYTSFHDMRTNITWKVRVSDHNANPDRCDKNTISFIVPCNSTYSKVVSKFQSLPSQYLLNENGNFVEQFYDVKECLLYNLD